MVDATKACLAPDAFLDADIINRLWQFYKLEGVSLKKFSKCIRRAETDDVDQFVLPFLHTLPAISGRKGKAAKKAKSKAAILIITKPDVRTLWTQLVKTGQSFKDFRRFIQRGPPAEVLKTIKRAAKSRNLSQLDARLQVLIRNRAGELGTIHGEENVVEPNQSNASNVADDVEGEGINLDVIEKHLQKLSKHEQPAVVALYQQALSDGHTEPKAKKMVRRAVKRIVQSNAQVDTPRQFYPTPVSPEMALPTGSEDIGLNVPVPEGATKKSKKRKRALETPQSLAEEPAATRMPKPPSALTLDGPRDMYEIPLSSPSSRSSSMQEFRQHRKKTNESDHEQEPRAKKRRKEERESRKDVSKDMTGAEERLLLESLGAVKRKSPGSANKQVKNETKTSSTAAVEVPEVVPATPIDKRRRMLSDGSSEEDLLRESLSSTSRPRLFTPSENFHARAKHQAHSTSAQIASQASPAVMIGSRQDSSVKSHKKRKRSSLAHANVLADDELVAQSGESGDRSKHALNHRLLTGSNAVATPSVEPPEKQSLEDALLIECLAKTARKSPSSNASNNSSARAGQPLQATPDASILLSIEQSDQALPPRPASQELGDPIVSAPKKGSRKRRRLSPLEVPELQLQSSDMLEVDESDHDAQGNKIEKLSTIKKRKKKTKHNTSHNSTPKEPERRLVDAQSPKTFSKPNELPSDLRGDEGKSTYHILDDAFERAISLATDSLHDLGNSGMQSLAALPSELHSMASKALASAKHIPGDVPLSNIMQPSSPVPSVDDDILAMTPKQPRSAPVTPRKQTGKSSRFFTPSPSKKPRPSPGTVSCIKAPPLSASTFGLIQEELAGDPFRLLVAVIFLNRTRGAMAIPLFRKAIECYPDAESMSTANVVDIAALMQPLGLQNNRAATLINLANIWVQNPPVKGWRFRTPTYPTASTSNYIKADEVLTDDDARQGAFEIGHIPGLGAYAFDSWRIFCRDELRGLATSWNGEGADAHFEPEWKRVVPKDKELRAFLRWMWLKEGWKWDPETGDKEVASEELMRKGEEGGLTFTDYEI